MMKKKILFLTFAAISFVAFIGLAQSNNGAACPKGAACPNKCACANCKDCTNCKDCPNCKDCTNCKDCPKCKDCPGKGACKAPGKACAAPGPGACKAGDPMMACPFDGLNLTDDQKTRLQELNAKRMDANRERMQAKREMTQRNDSACRAECAASKKAYLEEIKAILGPEKYVSFLENMYINADGQRPGPGKAPLGRPQGKKGKRM